MELNKILKFLIQLRKNNNRTWFKANKDLYDKARVEFEGFIEMLIPIVTKIDPEIELIIVRDCIFRIYRDVRFSKSKVPYKTNFGAYIAKGGKKSPFAGFYIHIEPMESFIGGGVYMPKSKYLKAIRTNIYENIEKYKEIINNRDFKKYFNKVWGDKLKLAPKGFSKDFPDIELLKNKHFVVAHSVNDSFWTSRNLMDQLYKIFKAQLTFNKFINSAVKKEFYRKI